MLALQASVAPRSLHIFPRQLRLISGSPGTKVRLISDHQARVPHPFRPGYCLPRPEVPPRLILQDEPIKADDEAREKTACLHGARSLRVASDQVAREPATHVR
jgi:hypothetical protein